MQRAVNPQTGEVLFLVDNKWTPPAQKAKNDAGDTAYLVANQWQIIPGSQAVPAGLASLAKPEPILSPEEQMMGAVGAAPQENIPRLLGGQAEMRPYEPSLTDQLMELLPGNKARAANEYAARQIAKERGVPVGEIYKDIGGARPMFNPEGRAPIRAGIEAAKITAQELPKVPEATLSTFLKAYRAGDIEAPADAGMVDKAIAAMKPTDAKGKPDPNYESFLGLGESLGFSVATMVASLTAAAAGEVVAGPVGGVSAGMAASGAMAYRASKDDFLSRVLDKLNGESQKLYGTNISPEDWNKAKQEYNRAAVEYGAWEAIPEAISNAVFIKAFAAPAKAGRGADKIGSFLEKVGSQGVEQATETITALGQNAAEKKAGLSDEELTIADAFRQQFIQTLLIGGTMAGGFKAKELGDRFYQNVVEPRVRPGSALAKAIQADVDAVAFNPESTRRAAVEALNPNRAKEQVVAEPGIASLIQKQQIAMPPPPEEPEEILKAPSSESQDMDAMLREVLGEPAPTISGEIVKEKQLTQEEINKQEKEAKFLAEMQDLQDDVSDRDDKYIETPAAKVKPAETVFTAPAEFAYSITQSPAYEGVDPLSAEDAQFELDVLLENAKRGRLTPQRFAESEIGRRLDTPQIMAINDGIRNNPIATIEALIQKVAPAKVPATEAPKEPTLKEQYDKAAKLNLMAPDAFRDRRITQEQYDQIQADYERIKTQYQASIPKATLTPIQQEATVIADGLEELGQTSFVTGMRSAIERNQVNKDNLEFYRSRLKQEQAKQNALDEGIERPSEKFEWTKFFRDDPKDLNKLKLLNSKAPPAVKQALQTVTDTLQALTNRLNDEGYTMYGTPSSTVPQEIKNLRSQIQMRSAGGVKLINAFEALDKGFNRSKKTTNQQNLDAAIQDIKVDAAEAQKVLQRSIPEPEEIVNARGTLAEARKQMDALNYKSGSLWSALVGKLDPEEVREIFGRNPSLGNKKLQVTKKSGKRGTYITELAADGILDPFLPPKMRHKSDMFDAAESAQYIKDAVDNKDYLPHDVKEEIKNIQKAVEPLGDLIDEYLTIEEQNRELQIAFDEQREIDQAAEIVEPESEDRPAEPSERQTREFKLTAPTKDELKSKQDEIDRLSKENERLSKEADRKAKADEQVAEFALTGSDREADQAASRGQRDIFAEEPKSTGSKSLDALRGVKFTPDEDDKKAIAVYKKIKENNPEADLDEDIANPNNHLPVEEIENRKGLKIGDLVYEKGDPDPNIVITVSEEDVTLIDPNTGEAMGSVDIENVSKNPIPYDYKFDFGYGEINVNVNRWMNRKDEWSVEMSGPGASETGYRSELGLTFKSNRGTPAFEDWVEKVVRIQTKQMAEPRKLAKGKKGKKEAELIEEAPKDNKQEIADLRKEQKSLMLQIIKAGMQETPVQEARMAEIENRINELEGKPAKPVVKQRSVEEIEEDLQDLEDQIDGEILKEKRMPLIEKLSRLEGELTAAKGRAARAAAEAAPTEAETEAAEEAAEEAIRNKAEAEVDEGPIGQAIAKIENGDIETKGQIRTFIAKLERDGTLDDVEDVREGLSDREQDASEVLDTLNGLLDDARDTAIDERVDELLEERAQEEPEAPKGTVATPDGYVLRYPLAVSMVGEGYKVLALDDPRTYKDKGGEPHRTFEKGPLRIAMTHRRVLFQNRNAVIFAFGNSNDLTIEAIIVDPGKRNQGLATQAMNDVIEAADKNEITLYLEPAPIVNIKKNDFGLDRDQLVDFYSKFGFEFQEDSSKVMERKPSAEAEVLPAEEPQIAGQVGFEPFTVEGESRIIDEEVAQQVAALPAPQVDRLEKHYGVKRDTAEFIQQVQADIAKYVTEGAQAVASAIRSIIKSMAEGVLAVGIVFNPNLTKDAFTINLPRTFQQTIEIVQEVPEAAKAQMSPTAQSVYQAMAPVAIRSGKWFMVADKPNGMLHIFEEDGSHALSDPALYGKDTGDVLAAVSSLEGGAKITPAGKFTLEKAGKASLVLVETQDSTGFIAIHAADTSNKAENRLGRLATKTIDDNRISYGCINTNHNTFRENIAPNIDKLNGGMIFVLPDAQDQTAQMFVAETRTETKTEGGRGVKGKAAPTVVGREQQFFSVEGKKLPPGRSPELAAAARLVKEGKMTAAEFDKLVNKYRPIRVYEEPLKPATRAEMVDALSSEKKDKVSPDIPEGTRVGLRLDIPAFNRKGVYVVTIHEKGNASGPGKAIGYDSVAVINNVNFGTGSQRKALNIATGEAKDALQTMEGEFVKSDPASVYAAALKAMDDPSWTQIGVDPTRHAYFFDRNTTQPVIAADQVIQIGNTVLAKNVTYGRKEDFLYNLEDDLVKLVNDTANSIDETEKKRSPSFKRKAKVLTNQRNEGKLTDEEYLERMNAAIAEDEANRLGVDRKDRVRGADFIREKLLNAKRNGFLSDEAVDLAEWFIGQNPDLVDDLGISIKAKGPEGAGGFYNAMARVFTLIKEGGSDLTTTHEILHHLERMMPAKIQAAIRKAWLSQLLKANKSAKDPAQKLYFNALLDAHIGNNNHDRLEIPKGAEKIYEDAVKTMTFINEMNGGRGANPESSALAKHLLLYAPTVTANLYEYFDPSEFWAVNGSDIVRARYDAVKGGVLAKLKNWLREFIQKIKSLFGMKSDASIIRALDSLAKSDGRFVTDEMLGTGDYQNIKKNAFGGEMPEATWAMRESTFGNDWMQRWQDNYRDLKNVQKSITEQIGKIDDRLNAYRKQTVNPGREAERQGDFVKYEVDPLVKEMIANKVSNQELATYLHNRYAEERNEIINAKNKNPAVQNQGSGISTEKARTYMEALPADRAQVLEKLAKRIDAIVRGSQDLLVQSGQETQETIDGWRQSSPHYVPLQRDESELDFIVQTGTGSLGGYATAGKFGKEAIGSTKTVKNILENVMLQRDRAIRRAESIRIGQALYGMAIQYPNPDFWMAINPDAVKDIDALIAEMEGMGLDPELIENILEQPKTGYVKKSTGPEGETLREVRYRVDRAYQNAKNVFPIRINGQNRYVLFNPKSPEALRLAAELKSLNPEQLNLFFGVASSFSRWFAAVNTQYNPVFGLVNFWNDTQGALINLSTTPLAGRQKEVMKNLLPAMYGIARDIRKERKETVKSPIKTTYGKEIDSTDYPKLWRLYRNGGGKTAFRDQMVKPKLNVEWKGMMPNFSYTDAHTMLEALEKIERGPISKKVEWWADCFSDFNDTLENTARLSVFKVAYVDMKLSLDESIEIAKNITVDFNRRGARTKNVRGMYVFFNAALQSNARIAITLASPAGKAIVKAGLAMGALNAMWMFLAGFDDDDPPQFTRNKGFIIPTGDGDYQIWNLPQGWRAIPNTGRLVTEGVLISLGLMKSNKGMAGKISDAGGVVFDAINPFGGGTLLQTLAPTFLDPAMALAENKDSFGRPIFKEDQSLKPTPGWQRTRDSASTFSKGLSWLLNYISAGGEEFDKGFLSPTGDQLDYLISQAAGGFARDVKRTGEWAYNAATGEETPSYRRPVLNRFMGETKTDAATSARFYDNVTMLARYENVINGRIENKGDVQGYLKENPLAKFAFVANDFENEVSSINRTIRDLQNMDETPSRKQQIKDLKASRVELMKNFNNMVRQAQ